MQAFDKFLGPLAPHRQAARTAPRTRHVLVMDATSEQGRSVCESLIKDNRWVVWGLVEDKEDVIAKALLAMQVKLIVGSLSMPASYESHLKDKDGVFLHVDFEELHERANGDEDDYHKTADAEIAWTTKLVDACVRENVRHFVYSALDELPGNLSVPHCYAKSQVVKYIKSTSLPTTFLYTSTPFSYILWKHTLQSQPDGTFLLDLPVPDDCVLPGYPTEQTGEWVKMALKGGDKWIDKDMTACTEKATPIEFAAVLEKLGGKKVDTHHLSREEFLSEDHRESLGDVTWSHYKAFYEGAIDRDVKKSESVVPFQWSFRQWAGQNPEIKRILAGEKEAAQGQ